MAKENSGKTLRDYGQRRKRYRRVRALFIYALILLSIVVGVLYLIKLYNKSYQSYEIIHTISNTGEAAEGYLSYGNDVVKFSKDGAVAMDKDGDLIWNGSYEMTDPIADICDKYVVVADRGKKSLVIFNEKGVAGEITTLYDIVKVRVAAQGVVAVLMEDGGMNNITLYSKDGTNLGEKVTYINDSGYPLDIALSSDGEKLVVSYLSVTTGKLNSTVAFFNFGEVGQNQTDRFVGGYDREEIVIPRVVFLNNDVVGVYKENGFMIYSMRETPKLRFEETLEQKIQSVLYNEKYVGVVLKGEEASSNLLLLYDLDGDKVLERKLNVTYDKISLSGDEIIMHDNLSCVILKTNGKEKFRYTFDSNIDAFYPINRLDRYYLINSLEISEIKLLE